LRSAVLGHIQVFWRANELRAPPGLPLGCGATVVECPPSQEPDGPAAVEPYATASYLVPSRRVKLPSERHADLPVIVLPCPSFLPLLFPFHYRPQHDELRDSLRDGA